MRENRRVWLRETATYNISLNATHICHLTVHSYKYLFNLLEGFAEVFNATCKDDLSPLEHMFK